jgi:hypothetical protein
MSKEALRQRNKKIVGYVRISIAIGSAEPWWNTHICGGMER